MSFLLMSIRLKNILHIWTLSWDIALSGIFQSDWSRASFTINQKLELHLTRKLKLEVKYHNHSPFKLFSGKWNDKFFLQKVKIKLPYFGSLLTQTQVKIKYQFLTVKITDHISRIWKNLSMTPSKNIELANWSSERQADYSDLIGTPVCRVQYTKKT